MVVMAAVAVIAVVRLRQARGLVLRQAHYVNLLHGTPPCATQRRRFAGFFQPDILAVTEH